MAITPVPNVPSFPVPVPNYRTQDDAEFNESMQDLVDTLNPFHAGMVAMALWMQQTGNEVTNIAAGADSSAQDAAVFAGQARAVAAYKGLYTSLPNGTLAIPASVFHNGKLWQLLQTTANIQTQVPGVSSVWYDLTVQGGLQLVSSTTDMRPERAVNPAWLLSRGIGIGNFDLRNIDISAPSVVGRTGVRTGLHEAVALGIPGKTFLYGALTIIAPWDGDGSTWNSISMEFRTAGEVWIKRAISTGAWSDWSRFGEGGGGGPSSDGPIKTQVQNFSANSQDGSGNIAITINCAEHSSFVINAQNSPFPSAVGAYNVTITNLPAASEGLFIGRIRVRNLGRKAVNFILPAGLTASWLSLPTFSAANTAAATTWDWVEFIRSPDNPNVIYFDQVNGR